MRSLFLIFEQTKPPGRMEKSSVSKKTSKQSQTTIKLKHLQKEIKSNNANIRQAEQEIQKMKLRDHQYQISLTQLKRESSRNVPYATERNAHEVNTDNTLSR